MIIKKVVVCLLIEIPVDVIYMVSSVVLVLNVVLSYSSEFENPVFCYSFSTNLKNALWFCFSSGSKLEKSFDSDLVPVINRKNVIDFDSDPGFWFVLDNSEWN